MAENTPNLIQLVRGSKAYGSKILFDRATFSINEGEHVGVIGPNGAGKSTLFKVIIKDEELDSGELVRSRSVRIGYLPQIDNWKADETVEDYITREALMPIWDLKQLGLGLGLTQEHFSKPMTSLSGGYRMRAKLLRLLGLESDLLLLDEPTNYLDLESILVLENFLQGFRKSFLLISHDREFLRRTTDHILEIESGEITKFNGSLDDYFEQKELLRTQLEAKALSIEERRKEILDFVARFGAKATKAKQAQSRLKSLDRLETVEIKDLPSVATIRIPEPASTGKVTLTAENLHLGYGDRTILSGVELHLHRGDHLAVVGVNGAGKSTLLKTLAGALNPIKGSLKFGHEVSIGYYAQHVSEALLADDTVVKAMGRRAHPSVTHQQILNLAGALLFSGDDVHKKVSVLSGGEKSRVALGQILLERAPLLVLDEPTNHLDFQTVEALAQALHQYPGTLVVVSHDRSFVRRVATKILEVSNGTTHFYPGSYDDYLWFSQRSLSGKTDVSPTRLPLSKAPPAPSPVAPQTKRPNDYEQKKAQEKEIRRLEKKILTLEARMQELEEKRKTLNDQLVSQPHAPDTTRWIRELTDTQSELSTVEEDWILTSGQLTELESP